MGNSRLSKKQIWFQKKSRNLLMAKVNRQYSILIVACILLSILTSDVSAVHFLGPIKNATVTVGRDASLSCSVGDLGIHRVGWIHLKREMIVAVHSRMITRIDRYSVTHDSHTTWSLHITGVKEEDRGYYMCQINTQPVLSQVGHLQVVVPPTIVDNQSSPSEIQVREKKNVTLRCAAKGFPETKIRWRREDSTVIFAKNKKEELVHDGEILELEQVSRTHMGAYLCIASNGVPPSVSKRIILKVEFPPQIHVPNQLVGVPTGSNITIECHVEAFPKAISYWVRGKDMVMNSSKYWSQSEESMYRIHMRLTVRNFSREDNTTYKCVAKNSLGETEGDIRLNEIYVAPNVKGIRSGESLNQEIPVIEPSPVGELVPKEEEQVFEPSIEVVPHNEMSGRVEDNHVVSHSNFPVDQGFVSSSRSLSSSCHVVMASLQLAGVSWCLSHFRITSY